MPTVGGANTFLRPLIGGGGYDQRERPDMFGHSAPFLPFASRPDVVVFETEPLAAHLEIIGLVKAHLWIASDTPDTDITAKLIDVRPSGLDWPSGFAGLRPGNWRSKAMMAGSILGFSLPSFWVGLILSLLFGG